MEATCSAFLLLLISSIFAHELSVTSTTEERLPKYYCQGESFFCSENVCCPKVKNVYCCSGLCCLDEGTIFRQFQGSKPIEIQ